MSNARGKFVGKFIFGVFEFFSELSEGLSRIPYKGVRFNDLDIYGYSHKKAYSGFKNLEYRGLINRIDNESFKFTDKGRIWFQNNARRYFRHRYQKWDKKWRLVIFDIPKELHAKRDTFRRRLRYLGFFMLQKSVFVFPYPCEEEISEICSRLKIADYVDVVIAESIGSREDELLRLFKL